MGLGGSLWLVGALASAWLQTLWPVLGGASLAILIEVTIRYRTHRLVRHLGIPTAVSVGLRRRYDTDPTFASQVDSLLRGWTFVRRASPLEDESD